MFNRTPLNEIPDSPSNVVSKPLFEALLPQFASDAGARKYRIILLLIDNAGWHRTQNLSLPDGIELICLPPYKPELQLAEMLRVHVDEPIDNPYFKTIRELHNAVAVQCQKLTADQDKIKSQTGFSWSLHKPSPN